MFSIKESIKYGWSKSKENMELVFFSTLLTLAAFSLTDGFGFLPLFNFIAAIFLIVVRIGYTKIFLKMHDGESPKFSEIFKESKTFWRYLGTMILTPVVIIVGLILLIVPGIILAVRLSFGSLIVVDTNSGPIASLKESFAVTKGSFWKIFMFWITIAFFNLLGLMFFGIGLLITVPVSTFASIYVYRELSKAKASLAKTTSPQTA